MALTDALPDAPMQKGTAISIDRHDAIETSLPALTVDYGESVMDDLTLVIYLATESTRALIGFDAEDGWQIIESVSTDTEFEIRAEGLYDWVDVHGAIDWFLQHGGDPDADLGIEVTNMPNVPEFMKQEPEPN